MSRMSLLRVSDYQRVRWKNDGGWTTEIARDPAQSATDFRWRVSVADIERDGPFSAFSGITRWFAVLEGAGVELKLDERWQRVRAGDAPLCFDGSAAPDCSLIDGPTCYRKAPLFSSTNRG